MTSAADSQKIKPGRVTGTADTDPLPNMKIIGSRPCTFPPALAGKNLLDDRQVDHLNKYSIALSVEAIR
jgi:hypothetical protein